MNLKSRLPLSAWLSAASFALGVLLGGCATAPVDQATVVQRVLDRVLPRDFKGTVHLVENFPGAVSLTIDAQGVQHNGTQWTWTALSWKRNGVWTHGTLTLEPEAK